MTCDSDSLVGLAITAGSSVVLLQRRGDGQMVFVSPGVKRWNYP